MKILVTGSNGTIGTRLCEFLINQGHEVIGIDRLNNKWNETVDNITLKKDLLENDAFDLVPTDIDAIIHLAANARVYNLVVDPSQAMENFQTLFNTLEFARKNNISKFIFASSREVYGNTEKKIHHENDQYIENCESPYTASKIGGEALVHSYNQCYDINTIILRFSNVYGMYDGSDRIVPLFIRKMMNHEDVVVFGENKELDFTYIDDNVKGIINCIDNFDNIKNTTYNLASGKGVKLLDLARIIKEKLSSNSDISTQDSRTGEITHFIGDINRAREHLEYEPVTFIEEGVEKSIEWIKNNN